MASGLPIIAHDALRMRFVAGDDEFLMDTESPVEVAQQIERARKSLPAQSQQRARKAAAFSWTNIAQMYRTFLHELLG
jgi:glycosyltransferase involved in cell wall biosynthesis